MNRCPRCGGSVVSWCDKCTYCGVSISAYISHTSKQLSSNQNKVAEGTAVKKPTQISDIHTQIEQNDHVIRCPQCGKIVSKIYDRCFDCGYGLLDAKLEHNKLLELRTKNNKLTYEKTNENGISSMFENKLKDTAHTGQNSQLMKCPRCGENISIMHEYCFNCGCALHNDKAECDVAFSQKKEHGIKLFAILVILFLLVGVFVLYQQNNMNTCPFSKLEAYQNQEDIKAIFGYPLRGGREVNFPAPNDKHYRIALNVYSYKFMNNTGELTIYYGEGSISSASYRFDYPLNNPSPFDNSVQLAEERVKKLASHIIEYYTKKHGNYKMKRDSYVWNIDDDETITLDFDPADRTDPIELRWKLSK